MKTIAIMAFAFSLATAAAYGQGGYSSPIRIMTPVSPRCINSKTDEITIDLKRILLQKKHYLFTQDSEAGVAVLANLNATGDTKASAPSISTIPIKDEPKGQVSLAIEYPVADELALTQAGTTTRSMLLDIYIEKAKGTNAFGSVLNLAGAVLKQLPIPDNPYTAMASSFLTFTNQSINSQISDSSNAEQIASINLLFNDRDESDANACSGDNFETTGAIAVLKSDSGVDGEALLPTVNLDQTYCFRYETTPVAELQYVARPSTGCTALGASATWTEVPNDYLMLLISAAPTLPVVGPVVTSAVRTQQLEMSHGNTQQKPSKAITDQIEKKAIAERQASRLAAAKLCKSVGSDAKYCGVK